MSLVPPLEPKERETFNEHFARLMKEETSYERQGEKDTDLGGGYSGQPSLGDEIDVEEIWTDQIQKLST